MNATFRIRHRFERRVLLFRGLIFLFLFLLFIRLVNLQWVQHEGLLLQAEQNRISIVPLLPTRGEIVDRDGRGLAVNHVSYQIQLIPERVADMKRTLRRLTHWLHWDAARLHEVKQRIAHSRPDHPVLLDDQLPWRQVAPIAARLHELAGVDVQAGTHRYYPYGALTSHLVGYLSMAGPEDVRKGILPMEKVGRAGAEKVFESELHGRLGNQREEVDARGRRVGVLQRQPPVMGKQLRLSLDVDLQRAASKALGHRTGAVVVMDVHTGEVLVLLSKPGFNTNLFITGLEAKQWKKWLNNPHRPLLDRATQASYPPGSTFKPLVALAGLRDQAPIIAHGTTCRGYIELADRKLRCWKKIGHGHVDLHKAIVQSCDVYFYELGDELGIKQLRAEAELWGFGKPTGIALSPEAKGLAPGQSWSFRRSRTWFRGQTMISAIGQGSVNATPIQMARFTAAIANGGLLLHPQLKAGATPEVDRKIDVDAKNLDRVRKAMHGVVTEIHGTAHAHLWRLPWDMAGKTGTAQVVSMPQDGSESNSSDKHKDHAWFIGYAPYKAPQIAVAVLVEHGGHGGSAAAPVAAAIVRTLAQKEKQG